MITNTDELFELINEVFSDSQIFSDFYDRISSEDMILSDSKHASIELDDDIPIMITLDVELEIVTKVVYKEYTESSKFPTYKAEIAVGGIESDRSGILDSKYCFANMYYDENCLLMQIDFRRNWIEI